MIRATKVRIKPTPDQERQLWKSAGIARWAYNWTLARQEEKHKTGGTFILDGDLRKELTKLKQSDELRWLFDVSNNVTKQAIKDACDAYKKFFKGLADKPRFKSRKKSKPAFYHDTEKLKVKGAFVRIEKVGWVKTAERLPISCKYMNPRISFDGKYWYISVGMEQETLEGNKTDEKIGIDVGIKELAVLSNGNRVKNINKSTTMKKAEKRLRRLQRRASRKYEMNKEGNRFVKTRNIVKLELSILLLHRRMTNLRTNHIHQATSTIARTKPSAVVMEKLNVKGMMKNAHLSKAIAQQKLAEFKRQMQYKCEKYGIRFVEADRWFPSSRLCSSCGWINSDLKLTDRTFDCDCGLKIDRDLNAAINLSKLA